MNGLHTPRYREPVGEGEQEYAIGEGTYRFVVIDSNGEDLENVSGVACAHITIKKDCVGTIVTTAENTICENGLIETSVEVKGYSACSSGETESERRLVRRFKVHY